MCGSICIIIEGAPVSSMLFIWPATAPSAGSIKKKSSGFSLYHSSKGIAFNPAR